MFSEQKNERILVIEDDEAVKKILADEVIKNTPFEASIYNDIVSSLNDLCVPLAQDKFDFCLFSRAQAAQDKFVFMKTLTMPVFMLVEENACAADMADAVENGASGFILKGAPFLKQFHKCLRLFLNENSAGVLEKHGGADKTAGSEISQSGINFFNKLIGNVQHSVNNLLLPILLNMSKIELYVENGKIDELKNELNPLIKNCELNIGIVTELMTYMKELTAGYNKNKELFDRADLKQMLKAYIENLIK